MLSARFKGMARFLKVCDVTVLTWVRKYAQTLERPKIPMPPKGVIVVINEMGHFINGKPNKVWIEKAYDLKKHKAFV
ncbi:hypothetical protein AGMMS49949_08900 [Alphaproteobacteria bacterium]|nr:hypothetical protein AGMMS49949_08900 [Alphaproteobacteria bacterium]